MSRRTTSRNVGKLIVKSKATVTEEPAFVAPKAIERETIKSIVSKVASVYGWSQSDVTEIVSIFEILGKNNKSFIDLKDRYLLFENINMISKMGIKQYGQYVEGKKVDEDLVFNSSIFERQQQKELLDAEIFLNRDKVMKGAGKCGKCGGDNLSVYEIQAKSSDEPIVSRFTCIGCGNRWRE